MYVGADAERNERPDKEQLVPVAFANASCNQFHRPHSTVILVLCILKTLMLLCGSPSRCKSGLLKGTSILLNQAVTNTVCEQ